ncbi:hypothetical protein BESB_082010 [Besnoitia besnoiti]|uniref:SRS domain-containing protein n=1 Tax=Besnoitia besnoiti TaxID=94643 RepID=A0A2A9MC85_BESBE|nr:hypothetical protein BESB_082010 [Besnoitia besnoiti]PFH33002.1 hypothetical protein BESB_082010 [Besnoitia besnoiti]
MREKSGFRWISMRSASLFLGPFCLAAIGLSLPVSSTPPAAPPQQETIAPECSGEEGLRLTFQVQDTEKKFKCPKGWVLEPTAVTAAFQGKASEVELERLVAGAKLEESEKVYKLSLPSGPSRNPRTWYYLCKGSEASGESGGDGGEPSHPGSHMKSEADPRLDGNPSPSGVPKRGEGANKGGEDANNGVNNEDVGDQVLPHEISEPHGGGGLGPQHGLGNGHEENPKVQGENDKEKNGEHTELGPPGVHPSAQPPTGSRDETDPVVADRAPADEKEKEKGPEHALETLDLGSGLVPGGAAPAALSRKAFRTSGDSKPESVTPTLKTCKVTVQVLPSTVIECNAGETKAATVSAVGSPVAFKCGAGLSLESTALDKVYDDKDGKCASQVALSSLVDGSLSVVSPEKETEAEPKKYFFGVDVLPTEQQALCYKCVETSSSEKEASGGAADAGKECQVKITVASPAVSAAPGAVSFACVALFGAVAGGLF